MATTFYKGFVAVWRPGSGFQKWVTGLDRDQFKTLDEAHFQLGKRLTSVDVYEWGGDSITGVWRNGSGAQVPGTTP